MYTLKQAVDDVFEMDYDNIPGVGPKMLFRKWTDKTMSLATPEHIVEFVEKLIGVKDPAALREALGGLLKAWNHHSCNFRNSEWESRVIAEVGALIALLHAPETDR